MADPLVETERPAARAVGRRTPKPNGRLGVIAIVGIVLLAAAVGLRVSPWAREQRYKRANLDSLKLAASSAPNDAIAQYYLGAQYHNQDYLVESLQAFERAIALDPRMTRAYVGAAVAHREIGQAARAEESARKAIELEPKNADARFLLATILFQGSAKLARPEFQKVTQLAPKRADGWFWLGTCDTTLSLVGDAVVSFTRAVELEPANGEYRRELGKVLLEQGKLDEANIQLARAVELAPEDPAAAYYRGKAQLTSAKSPKELREADGWLDRSLQLLRGTASSNPKGMAEITAERAVAQRRIGQLKVAEKLLNEARRLDPQNAAYLYQLAEVLRAQGNEPMARKLMVEYNSHSEIDNLIFELNQRIKQDGRNPELRLRLARLYVRANDPQGALLQYSQCLLLAPGRADVRKEMEAYRVRMSAPSLKPTGSSKAGNE